jgi:hypothetical protein
MAQDFDQFPVYDGLVKPGTLKMSDVWTDSLATFIQTLIGYLSQFGIFMPQITTVQRGTIQSPVPGQMIYNTDINSAQYWNGTTWISF